ncbi:MAG: quinolinate synthase NadA [Candidatus Coproplasma sp.]
MTVRELQDKIIQLKRETDTCILAHSYMSPDICEIADFTGDSYALSVKAKTTPQKNVIMCGVRFMAETVKMLSPNKRVYLANPTAGCPMAEQMGKEEIEQVKKMFPGYAVVAYINTTAQLKTISDVCVTSSSAVKICKAIPEENILFIPDINLGTFVKNQVPEKNFKLLSGGCPTHARVDEEEVKEAKAAHPDALFLVHPECRPSVVKYADYVGSTSGIMDYAIKSDAKEFIIGTENSILQHLQLKCPDKKFYPLSKDLVCHNMKATTLADVYNCLKGEAGEEIIMDEELISSAVKCINKMIEYGG